MVQLTEKKNYTGDLPHRVTEERYQRLFEDSIDGIYSVLRDGTLTDANPSFCELFGYTREEMIGKDIRELYLDPADRPKFQMEIEEKGFVKDYEIRFQKKDGTRVDCLLSSSVFLGKEGEVIGYQGILRDLTLRKGLRKQLLQAQKMEAVGTLAGGIAHDFNNLLQVILGYSDMLLINKSATSPDWRGLTAIQAAARDGRELVNRMLTFSRQLEPDTRCIDINDQIMQTKKMLVRTVPRIIDIRLNLAPVMPVNADSTQMEQVLMNLVVNARDAMPEGGVLTIETTNVVIGKRYSQLHFGLESGQYVLITVTDTGHGMDKETQQHIFEPFFTTKKVGEGTGLGLAMVYGIIKNHGGQIICYSEPGTGTTFKIYLPAVAQELEQDVSATQQFPIFGDETLLLVEDDSRIRELAEEMLELAGYRVLTAGNGREALVVYRNHSDKIDLILLDLMMPEMGGKQCLEELLKINPKVKVIIASGYSVNGLAEDPGLQGAVGFLSKPYDLKAVLKIIRSQLDL
jgi:two-component system, cell cycle sensor histidine kinase and response regulator CckA